MDNRTDEDLLVAVAWRSALAIFRELGMAEATEVAARLNPRRP